MLLVLVAVFSLFAMNRTTLLPLFADQVLHVGAHGFGFLMASMGLGSLMGALTLAFVPRFGADPRRQLWMAAIWVAALLEFRSRETSASPSSRCSWPATARSPSWPPRTAASRRSRPTACAAG